MNFNNPLTRKWSVSLLILIAAATLAVGDERGSERSIHDGQRPSMGLNGSKCSICHGKSPAAISDELPVDVRGRDDGWIRGDELLTWVKDDLHYQAFAVLLDKQSQEMAKRLGVVDAKGNSLVHQDRRCLACHSSVPASQMSEQMKLNGDLLTHDTSRDALFTIGVSCEACHGPTGTGKDGAKSWGEVHVVDPLWRTMNSKRKHNEYGYWDVHSTRSQAQICLSCHMGNVEQQKVITHEMYAAGHPPLPSFELSQFTRQMPRHWRRLDEKPQSIRDKFLEDTDERDSSIISSENLAATKATMIAALVTLEESMKLSADLMDSNQSVSQWPELANYSCYACHHELQRDGWRKAKRFTSKPGRPPLQEWPFALARAVVTTMKDDEPDFQLKIRNVASALDSKPYGDPIELKKAISAMGKAAEVRSRKLSSLVLSASQAHDFLDNIAGVAAAPEYVDYDSARQLAWAYERTHAELELHSVQSDKHPVSGIASGATGWTSEIPFLNDLDRELILWLPGNRDNGPNWEVVEMHSGDQTIKHKVRVVKISESLSRIAKYRPESIQSGFKILKSPVTTVVETQK